MATTSLTIRHVPALALAVGVAGFGVLSLMSGDFGFQWQPVAKDLPDRASWAMAVGAAEIAIALALSVSTTRSVGAVAAAALYLFWSLLHAPPIVAKPANVAAWLGAAEPFAIAIGIFTLALVRSQSSAIFDLCVRAFGLACIVFGASHFVYADFTATMVPSWLPERLFLAYATGAIHAACGFALLGGVQRLPASIIEAAMMTSFVALVHLPRIAADASSRFEWTMLFAAVLLSASAWQLAVALHERRAS